MVRASRHVLQVIRLRARQELLTMSKTCGLLAFQKISMEGDVSFAKFDNFIYVIKRLFNPDLGAVTINGGIRIPNNLLVLINSLGYGLITIFVSLPLALIASYFLSKKMPFANVFRVIFFLPNIISIVALIYAFRMQFDSNAGLIYHFSSVNLSGEQS